MVAVIGETVAEAKDAAELIEIDWDILPSATNTATAALPDAAAVWEEVADSVCFVHHLGDKAAVDDAFTRARHIVTQHFRISRVAANPMEGRAALGVYDERDELYTLYAGLQGVHRTRIELATSIFKLPASRFRVISPDVGGGFGMKGTAFPELALVLWAARCVGRPVKWVSERSESCRPSCSRQCVRCGACAR